MENIMIDFAKTSGIIKPMNAVNNGPAGNMRSGANNLEAYKAANFPFARNHDASFYDPYGGEHIVDVHRIFKNFDADESNPENYIFEPTDAYLTSIVNAGTQVFYRLGASIEHYYKYGTRVPKDYAKWARICEHIIMHYNEGWANGFDLGIKYWEIWNEPECTNADGSNPCWQGTEDQFIDFYEVVAKHLKGRFPELIIGGPAFTSPSPTDFKRNFLKAVKERNIPFDFYSFHWYGRKTEDIVWVINKAQSELSLAGLSGTPTILNEWNYVRGWRGNDIEYSYKTMHNEKGASFVASVLCAAQANPLDMLMYYDARPTVWNGLFAGRAFEPTKSYYDFVMFDRLAKMGEYVSTPCGQNNVYICAAKGNDKVGMMLTYFNDNDDGWHKDLPVAEPQKEINLSFINPFPGKTVKATVYLTDADKTFEAVREEYFTSEKFGLILNAKLYDTYFIEFTVCE